MRIQQWVSSFYLACKLALKAVLILRVKIFLNDDDALAVIRHHVSWPVLQDFSWDCVQVHVQLRKPRGNLRSVSHRLSHKTTPQALTKKAGEPGEIWEESLSRRGYFITPGSPSVPGSLWWPFFRDPLSRVGLEQGASYSTERMKSWGNLHLCVLGPQPCSLGSLVSDAFMNKQELELHFHLWAVVKYWLQFSSVQWLSSVVFWFLRSHGLQHARLPCPSPTPGVYANSCPLSWWCHPTISSSVVPFSSLHKSFPASRSFQISQLFESSGQSIRISASMSVLPMNIQLISFRMDWFHLLAAQGTQESSPTPQFKHISSSALSFLYSPTLTFIHDYWKNHSFD